MFDGQYDYNVSNTMNGKFCAINDILLYKKAKQKWSRIVNSIDSSYARLKLRYDTIITLLSDVLCNVDAKHKLLLSLMMQ